MPENIEIGGLIIVPIREISYKNAKNEIFQYIKDNKNKRPYISELTEFPREIRLDTIVSNEEEAVAAVRDYFAALEAQQEAGE